MKPTLQDITSVSMLLKATKLLGATFLDKYPDHTKKIYQLTFPDGNAVILLEQDNRHTDRWKILPVWSRDCRDTCCPSPHHNAHSPVTIAKSATPERLHAALVKFHAAHLPLWQESRDLAQRDTEYFQRQDSVRGSLKNLGFTIDNSVDSRAYLAQPLAGHPCNAQIIGGLVDLKIENLTVRKVEAILEFLKENS